MSLAAQHHARLVNLYGPTEAAIEVSVWPCEDTEQMSSIPIGRPIWNTQLCILDADLNVVPPGVTGELYIGGVALARGYQNRPALTAERFIPNPFPQQAGERLYRTGDLTRWRPDGAIEYVGRIDHQVKVRGFRIELGEVETQLLGHDDVREAVVVARDSAAGKQLVGYIVPRGEVRAELVDRLREHLISVLPDYMVPAHLVTLDAMPLTPSGKLDRRALPEPNVMATADYVAPRNQVETTLVAIWREVLGLDRVGVTDNFFGLGGDSILSLQVIARARRAGLKITPRQLFERQTIEQLGVVVQVIESVFESTVPEIDVSARTTLTSSDIPLAGLTQARIDGLPVAAREIEDIYPLSPMQQGMLFHALHDPSSGHYVNQLSVAVEGLDLERFKAAWASVTARHAVLRTSFVWEGDVPHPLQIVHKSVPTAIDVIDWRGRAAAEINGFAVTDRARGFDFGVAPLQRVSVLRLGGGRHQLIWTHHHLLMDGWSTARQIEEVFAHYLGEALGPVSGRYRDYIAWLSQQDKAASEAFWKERLVALDEPTLLVDALAGARGRHEGADGHDTITCRLDAAATARLQRFAQQERVTLNTLVQAAWILLLQRYCGQRTVTFGATVAGRPADLPGAEAMLGLFINTLPVIQGPGSEQHIGDWLRQLQAENVMLREHEQVPLYDIQRWAGQPGQALFDTILVFENYPVDEALRARSGKVLFFGPANNVEMTSYPLTVSFVERSDMLEIALTYIRTYFEPTHIEALRAHLIQLLDDIATIPSRPLGTLSMLCPVELSALVDVWARGEVHAVDSCYLHQMIESRVAEHPDLIAVVYEDTSLTYGELNARANRLARHLRARGVGPDVLVGVAAERSLEMVIGLLGVLKAGGAYVPLDPNYPAERLAFMIEDAGVSVVVVQEHLKLFFQECFRKIAGTVSVQPEYCVLEDHLSGIDESDFLNVKTFISPKAAAYCIYTSGSTGIPKGVVVSHDAIVNHESWVRKELFWRADERVIHQASFAFDASILEIFSPLIAGGQCVIAGSGAAVDISKLLNEISDRAITSLQCVPSLLSAMLLAEDQQQLDVLRCVCLGGEQLPPGLQRQFLARHSTVLYNTYGPTEAAVEVSAWICTDQTGDNVPIGRPIWNTQLCILDRELGPVPVGVVGELYIGGAGLARGYHGRPGPSAERFVPNPFAREPGERLYRTGDLARWRPDGAIEYVGRIDHQVKVRGFRIELGEIEAQLLAQDEVREAVVVARDGPSGKQLVAYVVSRGEAVADLTEHLRERLRSALPDYMVPAHLVVLDALPLTPNGKLDRKALPEPDVVTADYVAPLNEVEEALAAIWQEVLDVECVGVTDNFFALGGDSILSLQIIARARRAGLKLTPKQLFERQTIGELAAVAEVDRSRAVATDAVVSGRMALLPIQQAFFAEAIPHRNHWNQSVLLTVRQPLDPATMEAALRAIVTHHDAFRLRFRQDEIGVWTAFHASASSTVDGSLLWVREARSADAQSLYEEAQRSLSIEHGPLLRALYVRLGDGRGRLLLVIHHLVVDGVSWRVLLEDLQTAYGQQLSGETIALPAKTSSFQTWAERLQDYAGSEALANEAPYWREQLSTVGLVELPRDRTVEPGLNRDAVSIEVQFDRTTTARLLKRAPEAYRTQVNDLLLTALARVLCRWSSSVSVLVALEGHGREDLFGDIDLSHTVGWFTSLFPVRLTIPLELVLDGEAAPSLGTSIKAIKEQLRGVPSRGLGYGILKHLSAATLRSQLDGLAEPRVTFNYLGQFDGSFDDDGAFVPAQESGGHNRDPDAAFGSWLSIDGQVYNGELRLSFAYSRHMYDAATIEGLAQEYQTELEAVIAHCLSEQAQGLTSSDIPLAGLTQARIDGLPVAAREIEDVYPLSPMQQGMLFHALHDPSSGHYVNQLSVAVEGLDLERFEAAWASVTARHAVLRTSFVWEGDVPHPLQIVHKSVPTAIDVIDWRGRAAAEINGFAVTDRARGFDFGVAPLQRVSVLRLGGGRHQLIWTHHHLLMDGWSTARQIEEVFAHYLGEALGPVSGRYRDYIAWLSQQDKAASEAFWKERLVALDEPTLLVDALAGARGRHEGADGHDTITCRLDAAATARLQRFAQQERVTLNTLVQAAWILLLQRYCGQRTVTFGATVAGRPADLPGAEGILGLFINTLPVIQGPGPEQHIGDWLRQLQAENVMLREHEQVPLYDIQRWAGQPGQALFDTILVFENYPVDEALRQRSNEALSFTGMHNLETTNYPMTVVVVERADGLVIDVSYMEARLDRAQVEAVAAHLTQLLEVVSTNAETPVGEVPLLLPGEYTQVVEQWSQGEAHALDGRCLHELIEARVREHPDAVAVVYEDTPLTYGELNARANRLARHLRSRGVGPDVLVGLAVERSLEMVVGLLGIIKAGGAYVPLDPNYPAERLTFMIEDAGVPLILSQERLIDQLPLGATPVWCLDRNWPEVESLDAGDLPSITTPQNLAYCIYTSGSTGRPKAVAMPHSALSHLLLWHLDVMPGAFRTVQFSSFSFDASFQEIVSTWLSGSQLIIPSQQLSKDIEQFALFVRDHEVERLFIPYRALEMLALYATSQSIDLLYLKQILTAGEQPQITDNLIALLDKEKQCDLVNLYGPSETHVVSAFAIANRTPNELPPIGYPIWNTQLYVLDPALNPLPPGVPGELYIGGVSLARGYHNRPSLTAQRFVPNPFSRQPGKQLYRTGDMVRWRSDGAIQYIGRTDYQVKVRGFRVELGEIETRLLSYENIREAVVVARDSASGKQLIAYVVPCTKLDDAAPDQLKAALRSTLPEYMIPAHIVALDAIPLTISRKLDRRALPEPASPVYNYVPPADDLERRAIAIWEEILRISPIGVQDDFFEIGGDSILAMQVVITLQSRGFPYVSLGDLLERRSVRRLLSTSSNNEPSVEERAIIHLRRATTPVTIYCLPPFSGYINCYMDLANRLSCEVNLIGFEALCVNNSSLFELSMDHAVDHCARYIEGERQVGPIALLGWSWGGLLAHALAKRVEAHRDIALVAMIDVYSFVEQFDETASLLPTGDEQRFENEFLARIERSSMRRMWHDLIVLLTEADYRTLVRFYGVTRRDWDSLRSGGQSYEYFTFTVFNRARINRCYCLTPISTSIMTWTADIDEGQTRRPIDWTGYSRSPPSLSRISGTNHDSILKSAQLREELATVFAELSRV
ncbi:MAG: hypothetical protein NTAFB05_08630 [Nitrobacter sp.]